METRKMNTKWITFLLILFLLFTGIHLFQLAFTFSHPLNNSSPQPIPVIQASQRIADPKPAQIVAYASTLLGIPYKVAGKDEQGFDCSGFVAYVFKKYKVILPSATKALIFEGREVALAEAEPGDIIFFTGTDPNSRDVGHAGIIVSHTSDSTQFIHSSSARSSACVKYTVLETSPGYQRRFLKVKRVL
jgi:cell wall-associated NlpC family hydrolase